VHTEVLNYQAPDTKAHISKKNGNNSKSNAGNDFNFCNFVETSSFTSWMRFIPRRGIKIKFNVIILMIQTNLGSL